MIAPVTRPATTATFVLALLFFVPLVTQVVSICIGAYAVGRRRQPGERVTLAWTGIIISLLVLPCWFLVGSLFRTTMIRYTPARFFRTGITLPLEEGMETSGALAEQVERIHRAAAAYDRDFRRWPSSVGILVGRSLPLGFTMAEPLTYLPVPQSERQSYARVLLVSDELSYGLNAERLGAAHRLICRISGKVELLPSSQVAELLDMQSSVERPEDVSAPTTGGGD